MLRSRTTATKAAVSTTYIVLEELTQFDIVLGNGQSGASFYGNLLFMFIKQPMLRIRTTLTHSLPMSPRGPGISRQRSTGWSVGRLYLRLINSFFLNKQAMLRNRTTLRQVAVSIFNVFPRSQNFSTAFNKEASRVL